MLRLRSDDGAEVPADSMVTVTATPPKVDEDAAAPPLDPLNVVDDAATFPLDLARRIIGLT